MSAPALYAVGGTGVLAALAGEVAGVDTLAALGYLAAVIGLFAGFLVDRKRG